MWTLYITVSNNQWGKEEITREIRKYLRMSENENTTDEDLLMQLRQCSKGSL